MSSLFGQPWFRRAFVVGVLVRLVIAVVAVTGVASVAQAATASPLSPPPAAPASPARARMVFSVTTADGVGEEGPVRPTDIFPPDATPIFVWFRHEGLAPEEEIMCDWIYEEAQPPVRISEACAVAGPSANAGHCSLDLAPGKPWAAGRYRVELRIDDTVVAETKYRVQGARAAPPYSHPRNGYQIVPPPGWTTSDQVPTADVQMNSPDGDAVIEITSGPIADRLDPLSFAIGWESVSVGAGRRLQVKRAGRETRIDGEMAYEGVYEGDGVLVKVFFVGIPERFWVVIGVFRNDGFTHGEVTFDRMMSTLKMTR